MMRGPHIGLALKDPCDEEDECCVVGEPADSYLWWNYAQSLSGQGSPGDIMHALRHAYQCGRKSRKSK